MKTYLRAFVTNQFFPLALVVGAAIIIAGAIGAGAAVAIKNAGDTLTVTGSATADVTADSARWTLSAQRGAFESGVPQATTQVLSDTKKIVAFLTAAGIPAASTTVSAVHSNMDYSYSKTDPNTPSRYIVSQDVTVSSNDPELIQRLSQDTTPLSNQGVQLSVSDPQYLISNLPQYRISLAGSAMQDAKARATQLVKNTGQSVGRLRSASTASVQVMAQGSMDVSDYGTYDTSTIDKTVMVTVRATFSVK
jgi:hypothetical protein